MVHIKVVMKIIQFEKQNSEWYWDGCLNHMYSPFINKLVAEMVQSRPNVVREWLYMSGIPNEVLKLGGVMYFDKDGLYWERIEFKNDADYTWFVLRYS